MQFAATQGNLITEMTFTGHGDPNLIQFGPDPTRDILTTTNDAKTGVLSIVAGNGTDLTKLLDSSLAPKAKVNLQGCKTATRPGSLTEQFSIALPGRTITGAYKYALRIGRNKVAWVPMTYKKERE